MEGEEDEVLPGRHEEQMDEDGNWEEEEEEEAGEVEAEEESVEESVEDRFIHVFCSDVQDLGTAHGRIAAAKLILAVVGHYSQ